MSYCKIILNGRLTRDVEVRTTPNGKNIAQFGVAYDTGWGQYKKTSFIDCRAVGKTGEFVSKWFTKGDGILLDGVLELDQWEDKQTGQKRSRHQVFISEATFAEGKKGQGGQAAQGGQPQGSFEAGGQAVAETSGNWDAGNDDNIPF